MILSSGGAGGGGMCSKSGMPLGFGGKTGHIDHPQAGVN